MLSRLLAALDGPTDAELLGRFAAEKDAGAFELLVWRHAGLVLRVCRATLHEHHAAEDAAQATFLALALQAGTVRGANLAGWLFRVALRIAGRASCRSRKLVLVPGVELDHLHSKEREPNQELQQALHEEIARLPMKYQTPILLCFFEGLTHAEAARRLGWPVGTVDGRVARAKGLLARQLGRRGVAPMILVTAAVTISPSFACSTACSAASLLKQEIGGVALSVLELAQREATAMTSKKTLRLCGILAAIGMLAVGTMWAADGEAIPTVDPAATVGLAAPVPPVAATEPPVPVIEKTFVVAPITTDLQKRLLDGQPGSLAVVFLDGSALFRSPKELDLESVPFQGIAKALKAYDHKKSGSRVHFQVHYGRGDDAHKNGELLLRYGMEGLGRQAGFSTTDVRDTVHNADFSLAEFAAPLQKEKKSDLVEARIGDDRVQAYPVRTALSRVLTSGADAVVEVQVGLSPDKEDWLPENVEKSAQTALAGLKLAKGKTVNFIFHLQTRPEKTQGQIRELSKRWAADHELTSGSFTY